MPLITTGTLGEPGATLAEGERQMPPWYPGMRVRWLSRKTHTRCRQTPPPDNRRGNRMPVLNPVQYVRRGEVFDPDEQEYVGIWDQVEDVTASLRLEEAGVPVVAGGDSAR